MENRTLFKKKQKAKFINGTGLHDAEYKALRMVFEDLEAGRFDPKLLLTGYTGLSGVENAINLLTPREGPTKHMKSLIIPEICESKTQSPDTLKLFD